MSQKSIFDEVVEGVAARGPEDPPGQRLRSRHADGAAGLAGAVGAGLRLYRRGRSRRGPARHRRQRAGERGYFVEPTVFADTRQSMKIVREEIFGPVVAAMPFDDPDEVLPQANDTTYGLAAAVWTRDVTQGPPLGPAAEGRHGLDQLLQCLRCRAAVRRLQGVGLGPRNGPSGRGALHRGQGRNYAAGVRQLIEQWGRSPPTEGRWHQPGSVALN